MNLAVVFDLDDTLYLEREYVRSGFNAVGDWVQEKYAISDFSDRCWQQFQAGVRGVIFDHVVREVGLDASPDLLTRLVEVYRQHHPQVDFEQDARAWLDENGLSYRLALITDGSHVCQSRKIDALNINHYCEEVVITDRLGREFWKPHPRAFEQVARALQVAPENCIYVGDNPLKDFTAPIALGWKTIRIRRPLGLHADVECPRNVRIDWEIQSLDELDTCLQSLHPNRELLPAGSPCQAGPLRSNAPVVERLGEVHPTMPIQPNSESVMKRSPVPVQSFAPWPVFDEEQIEAVGRVLRSGKVNYWTGSEGREFEREFAAFTGCRHAIAVANGTLALELALHALGIGPGDEVVVPTRTFIASASCVVARGARPVIADVDRDSQNITAKTIERVLTPRTKGIVAVHLAGWPCEMDEIMALARERGLAVIEDCAQAHGATYQGKPVGSLGDIAAFSFCQDKILTTGGEGGMLTTNRDDLWDRAWRYKDHGKTPTAFYEPQPPSSQFRWLHESFGSNFRMTEMQCAIGRIILRKLPGWVELRRRNADRLMAACRESALVRVPVPSKEIEHAYYKFYAFIEPDRLRDGWTRERVMQAIQAQGVPCLSGSCSEIFREQAFPEGWRPANGCPVGQELGETSLMFLVHPTLTEGNLQAAEKAIRDVLSQATAPMVEWRAA